MYGKLYSRNASLQVIDNQRHYCTALAAVYHSSVFLTMSVGFTSTKYINYSIYSVGCVPYVYLEDELFNVWTLNRLTREIAAVQTAT